MQVPTFSTTLELMVALVSGDSTGGGSVSDFSDISSKFLRTMVELKKTRKHPYDFDIGVGREWMGRYFILLCM